MITPDTRPIGVLTPAILATASHWAFCGTNGMMIAANSDIKLHAQTDDIGKPNQWVVVWASSALRPSSTCYPCTLQPNGLVVPEPWPVLDGEEEIEEWGGRSLKRKPEFMEQPHPSSPFDFWRLSGPKLGRLVTSRPNMHPAPRKGNRWVWEKDRC